VDKNSMDEFLEELILKGAVEVSALDPETGEFLYSFTDKVNEIDPELARHADRIFHLQIMSLWEYGFIDMNPSLESPRVSLNHRSLDPEQVQKLPRELRQVLSIIIQALTI